MRANTVTNAFKIDPGSIHVSSLNADELKAQIQAFVGASGTNGENQISLQIGDLLQSMNLSGAGAMTNTVIMSSMRANASTTSTIRNSQDGAVLTLTTANGKNNLKIIGADNLVVFEGPIDTDEQLDKVPAAYLDDLEKLMKLGDKNLNTEGINRLLELNLNVE